jgi:hypothetical protein
MSGTDQQPATHAIRILRSEDRIPVQATEASPGLYVYQLPDAVNPDDLYRWRIGHHTGCAVAIAMSEDNALAGATAIADLADWTQGADVSASMSRAELAKRLRRNDCYRAGY